MDLISKHFTMLLCIQNCVTSLMWYHTLLAATDPLVFHFQFVYDGDIPDGSCLNDLDENTPEWLCQVRSWRGWSGNTGQQPKAPSFSCCQNFSFVIVLRNCRLFVAGWLVLLGISSTMSHSLELYLHIRANGIWVSAGEGCEGRVRLEAGSWWRVPVTTESSALISLGGDRSSASNAYFACHPPCYCRDAICWVCCPFHWQTSRLLRTAISHLGWYALFLFGYLSILIKSVACCGGNRRGAIVTTFIVCYALTAFISGYVSGGFYSRNEGKNLYTPSSSLCSSYHIHFIDGN